MTDKAQILTNGHDDRQSTALSNPGRAMDSRNAVKQGFSAGKCVISTIHPKGAGRGKGCRARREKTFGAPAY